MTGKIGKVGHTSAKTSWRSVRVHCDMWTQGTSLCSSNRSTQRVHNSYKKYL